MRLQPASLFSIAAIARRSVGLILLLALVSSAFCAEPAYRTDGGDEKLPWFVLKQGEFPPAGSAHAISGELIALDHVNRTGVLRVDRNGSQRTDEYDHAMPFALLPYGSCSYHGSFAELRDIPIGTHLHGQFYVETKDNRQVFSKCLRLEDDFSLFTAAKRTWRVDKMEPGKQTLTLTGIGPEENQADPKPTSFVVNSATRVWKGRGYGTLSDVVPGDKVLVNLTVCTLKGPGRVTDIWVDAESRTTATAVQLETHRLFEKEHGLACWVEEVDNQKRIVTVTVFAGADVSLRNDFRVNDHIAAAVAEETMRTHDQNNDTERGPIVEVLPVQEGPGQSGLRFRFRSNELLEGFRPKRYLRIFGPGWHIDDLPREERAYDG